MGSSVRKLVATIDDVLALPEDAYAELIRGSIVQKASPTGEHSRAQTETVVTLSERFRRKGSAPGGWLFFTELDVQLGAELVRPDVCGYRRERILEPLSGRPIKLSPDWICEIVSESNADRDRIEKSQIYFEHAVPHYWILDPVAKTLEVFRRVDVGYARVVAARSGHTVRAEPFDSVELRINDLLGID